MKEGLAWHCKAKQESMTLAPPSSRSLADSIAQCSASKQSHGAPLVTIKQSFLIGDA